jgi:hypothetical protein
MSSGTNATDEVPQIPIVDLPLRCLGIIRKRAISNRSAAASEPAQTHFTLPANGGPA